MSETLLSWLVLLLREFPGKVAPLHCVQVVIGVLFLKSNLISVPLHGQVMRPKKLLAYGLVQLLPSDSIINTLGQLPTSVGYHNHLQDTSM